MANIALTTVMAESHLLIQTRYLLLCTRRRLRPLLLHRGRISRLPRRRLRRRALRIFARLFYQARTKRIAAAAAVSRFQARLALRDRGIACRLLLVHALHTQLACVIKRGKAHCE
jgi:hypothetical protein